MKWIASGLLMGVILTQFDLSFERFFIALACWSILLLIHQK